MTTEKSKTDHHFFVDEAGDLALFDKRGRIIVGQENISQFFMVGVAHIPNPGQVHETLEALRADLLADPYFAGVPSLVPERKKTAICFHAKNDLPEVRREVFRLLPRFGVQFRAVIRRKRELAAEAESMFQSGQKMKDERIYNDLVREVFKPILHIADENHIVFARRGKTTRALALKQTIAAAKKGFEADGGGSFDQPTNICSAYPSEYAGLQVVDYYLWALQRLYERGEERFFRLLAADYQWILDLDDVRNDRRGEMYCGQNPLSAQKIKPLTS